MAGAPPICGHRLADACDDRPRPGAPGRRKQPTALLDEVAYWQTDDFWQYAMYATVAYIRAASRAGGPVREACRDLGERPGHLAP